MARTTARHLRAEDPFARVTAVLGTSSLRIHSPIELHERIVEGLPRSSVVHLLSNLHDIKLDESMRVLNISSRTWHRIKADKADLGKPLDVDQSARLWSMAEILAQAEEVLGTREEAEQWLSRAAIGLDAHRPIDLMATPQGADLVKTLLAQMEAGVYA
jgi:putative toxin-antitoxin system antitoxin component (TIGR02293 family)